MKKILLSLLLPMALGCDDDGIIETPCERLLRLNPHHPCGVAKVLPTPQPNVSPNPTPPTTTDPEENLPFHTLNNPELANALLREGYSVKGNKLIINEKFSQTKELNLSNAGLKNLSGIELFTQLEKLNLSGNAFESFIFDTAQLPNSVQYLNLQNNEIYEFRNLAQTDYQTGEYTLQRAFKEIIFPAQARFNVEHLLAYYKTCTGCIVRIENAQTKQIEPLTSFRHIPNRLLYDLLKKGTSNLSNQFNDALQSINLEEPLRIQMQLGVRETNTETGMKPNELEGIEFVLNNPLNKYVSVIAHADTSTGRYISPYIKIFEHTERVSFKGIDTKHIDFSSATELKSISIEDNLLIGEINISNTKIFHTEGLVADTGLILHNLPQLTQLNIPPVGTSLHRAIQTISIENAPLLNARIGLKELKYIKSIVLLRTNVQIEYPEELMGRYSQSSPLNLQLSRNIYEANKTQTDAFKQRNGNIVSLNVRN